jgi:hypothetical protein
MNNILEIPGAALGEVLSLWYEHTSDFAFARWKTQIVHFGVESRVFQLSTVLSLLKVKHRTFVKSQKKQLMKFWDLIALPITKGSLRRLSIWPWARYCFSLMDSRCILVVGSPL